MSGWSQRESMALAIDLGRQGATVVDRKNGWTVRFPDGKTTMSIHKTPSGHRTAANYRAEVLRAGFRWPFDGEGFRKGGRQSVVRDIRDGALEDESRGAIVFQGDTLQPAPVAEMRIVANDGSVEAVAVNGRDDDGALWYPAHVTVDSRPSAKNVAAVRGAVVALGLQDGIPDDHAFVKFLRERNQMLTIESARRVLYWLGYRYDPETVRRVTRGFAGTWVLGDLDREKVEGERFPTLELAPPKARKPRAKVTTITGIEVPTGGEPVENPPTVSESRPAGEVLAELEAAHPWPPAAAPAEDPTALQVAEELLREAEHLSERRRARLSEVLVERDRAKAEVERLQAALARERSAPDLPDGAWEQAIEEFVHEDGIATIDYGFLAKLGITVKVRFQR